MKMANSNELKKEVKKEVDKVVSQLKVAQKQLESFIKNKDLMTEARKYADKQGKEIKKLLGGDVTLVKEFLERQKGEIDKLQKQIPAEINKLKKYIDSQKGDFEKLLGKVKKTAANYKTGKTTPKKKSVRKTIKTTKANLGASISDSDLSAASGVGSVVSSDTSASATE